MFFFFFFLDHPCKPAIYLTADSWVKVGDRELQGIDEGSLLSVRVAAPRRLATLCFCPRLSSLRGGGDANRTEARILNLRNLKSFGTRCKDTYFL